MKDFTDRFGVVDYTIFILLLFISAMTGLYFAFRHKIFKRYAETNLREYLTANRNLSIFPVSMSLVASYISGITMLGTPAEIYNYGTQYWLVVFAMILSGIAVATVYMPVFYKLQVSSSYEYLELRFNRHLRTVASLFFLFDEITFLPMLLYIPSLAFSQVSGLNLHIISAVVCSICIFYTVMGGLRAVVYTDTWQTVLMFISDMVVIIVGIYYAGGFSAIIKKGIDGGRFGSVSFSPSMYDRFTFFSVLIGGFTYWTSFNAVNQTMVQRYMSLPNDRAAKIAISIFTVGVVLFISMCCFAGVLIYSNYSDCDPLTAGRVANSDQLLPLFVMEVTGHLYGVPGLFIAGVFGAALSSLSVIFNSSAVVLLEDLFKGVCSFSFSERRAKIISKLIIILVGGSSVLGVMLVEHLGSVFEVATSFSAIVSGSMFGIFSLGMLIPWSNSKGAISGAIAGFSFTTILTAGSRYATSMRLVVAHRLPISVEGCLENYGVNVTAPEIIYPDESHVFPLFRLSYLWLTPINFVVVMVVGIVVSLITGKTDLKTLDPDLISPTLQWLLPEEAKNYAGTAVKKVENKRLLAGYKEAEASVPLDDMQGSSKK